MTTYEYTVEMTCQGCVNAVNRVLTRLDGVDSVDISLDSQSVLVKSSLPQEKITETIQKTGKKITGSKVIN
ncbi:hypothetical protein CANCADRAFT_99011 [Tortispora caseinolytica NRRL Y-17796]|uniref:HMA domain-containing protein n=1 Tax=Tortispora caseinolytica NRRL Y-17796 TaxID=767744 RepID=A0A1E4TDX8_9ASCO|nr:hypothetical protein CANCADRAFT_99011 [Tortispora caseinolytica NRRL Y-17796]